MALRSHLVLHHNFDKKMKSFITLLLAAALFSCSKEIEKPEADQQNQIATTSSARLATNENVKLFSARTVAAYYSRSYIREKSFYVEVANLSPTKQVIVHHKMTDGTWKDFPLSYVKQGENNAEIWGWDINYGVGTPAAANFATAAFDDQFVIKYIVNGQTFWDNNGNKNYNISSPLMTDGMFLQNGLNINADTYHSTFTNGTSNNVQIFADVRNLNFNKVITLVYTTDNWATVKYAPFNYLQQYAYGGSNLNFFPTAKAFEKWSATLTTPAGVTNIKYAISYKVNGQVFWDNNFTRNYSINRQ